MKRLVNFAILVFFFCCTICVAQSEVIRVSAGAAPTENILKKIKEPFTKATGISLEIFDNGPIDAFRDLEADRVDTAAAGLAFPDWLALLEKNNISVKDQKEYKFRVLGKDLITVILNKENPIKSLSEEQLKRIFSGEIKNWKELGSIDESVEIIWGTKIPGTNDTFCRAIMGNTPIAKPFKEVGTAVEVKQEVITRKGGIGLVPQTLKDDTINAPNIPEIGRPITFITKGAPSQKVLKLFDFIQGEGQKLIQR